MADGPNTTVVERRGSSGAGLLIGIALVILVAIAAYFVIVQNRNDTVRTDAISSAAKDVGDTAKKAGDAVDPNK